MRAEGFGPVFDGASIALVLGSFPSVKSRAEGFYYGNPQNRFWRTVCGYFGEEVPQTVSEKCAFLLRNRLALWDVVISCEIEGSSDASIRNERVADIPALMEKSGIRTVLCNGKKAFSLLEREYPAVAAEAKLLPSTSPANPRFSAGAWFCALDEAFGRGKWEYRAAGKFFQNG